MLDQVTLERVAAYDREAARGHVIYGRRGRPGVPSAAQAAAVALGLKTPTPILNALRALRISPAGLTAPQTRIEGVPA